eukprot:TRINITY_DN8004_c0_g3_i1.p1 TRINITY_DN8004_c0_g3~~TRINITY_DN8004_c0_g3_i1.p1  ORF type:complete len:441 (-),score=62.10 TRINITY_DN8004_c0_g3_i1:82-1404(-)
MRRILIVLALVSVFGMPLNEEDTELAFQPDHSNVFLDMVYSTGGRIKEYFDGFVFLVNLFYDVFSKKPRYRESEELLGTESLPVRLLQETEPMNNFDEDSSAGSLGKAYIDRFNNTIYYMYYEWSQSGFARHMNRHIYTPTNVTRCLHGGIIHNVTYINHMCDDRLVSKRSYEEKVRNGDNCTTELVNGSICACPRDYYGTYCEQTLPIFCAFKWINPTADKLFCNVSNNSNMEYYDDSRYGIPPCFYIGDSRSYEFEMALDCKSHSSAVEGVKSARDYLVEEPDVKGRFKYWINTSSLAVSDRIALRVAMSFLNFKHLSEIKQFVKTASMTEEITGQRPLKFKISFNNLMHLRYGGRWHFEVAAGLADPEGSFSVFSYAAKGVLDDAVYAEPVKGQDVSWVQAVVTLVGIFVAFALIVTGLIWYVRKRRKEQAFIQDID